MYIQGSEESIWELDGIKELPDEDKKKITKLYLSEWNNLSKEWSVFYCADVPEFTKHISGYVFTGTPMEILSWLEEHQLNIVVSPDDNDKRFKVIMLFDFLNELPFSVLPNTVMVDKYKYSNMEIFCSAFNSLLYLNDRIHNDDIQRTDSSRES